MWEGSVERKLQVLQPILDPTFSEHSYGFRPGRRAQDAVLAAQAHVQGVMAGAGRAAGHARRRHVTRADLRLASAAPPLAAAPSLMTR